MKASFYSNTILLGTIDFSGNLEEFKKIRSIGMGGIRGNFYRCEAYELIRKKIQDWNASQSPDFSKWHALKFNVQLENGYFLLPQGGFMVSDYADYPDEPLTVQTAGINPHILEDFYIQKKPFLSFPWRKLDIEEKLKLEDKYHNETSLTKKLSFTQNYLWGPVFSALGINSSANEVLYAVSNTKIW